MTVTFTVTGGKMDSLAREHAEVVALDCRANSRQITATEREKSDRRGSPDGPVRRRAARIYSAIFTVTALLAACGDTITNPAPEPPTYACTFTPKGLVCEPVVAPSQSVVRTRPPQCVGGGPMALCADPVLVGEDDWYGGPYPTH